MLLANTGKAAPQTIAPGASIPGGAIWLDLVDPTEAERAAVEAATGLRVPQQSDIVEIESSSRLRQEANAIYLSTPLLAPRADGSRSITAIGIVLSDRYLITLRFADLPVFTKYAEEFAVPDPLHCSASAFLGLMEAVVDRLADILEHVGSDLDRLSRRIFHTDGAAKPKPRHTDAVLRATLQRIGAGGDLISNLRDSLLGLARIVPYVGETGGAWIPSVYRSRVVTLRQDIASLSDYDAQLINKVQFLLDATLGFLNIEQNNGLKILTVVSIVGIPPTLIASIYGMNFKNIPELQWTYGYAYGLGLILFSIVAPLVWFRIKGWL